MRYCSLILAVVWGCAAGSAWADFPTDPPNDPYYQQYQWALQAIDLPAAWQYTTGSPSVTIAILDTGVVSTTPDLQARLLAPISATGVAPFSDTQLTNVTVLQHGTYVASVAAMGVNNGIGGAGVGNFSILPVTITNQFSTNLSSWIANGIEMAAAGGAKIINVSSSTSDYNAVNTAAADVAGQALVFMAAGNTDGLVNMSQFSNLIFVSGTDQNNQRWNDGQTGNTHGSSFGPYIDLAAPAANPILVADPGSPSGYGVGDGTSSPAPWLRA